MRGIVGVMLEILNRHPLCPETRQVTLPAWETIAQAESGICAMHLLDEPLTLVHRVGELAEAVRQFPPCVHPRL